MTYKPNLTCGITLQSSSTPASKIAGKVGFVPTSTWEKGDRIGRTILFFKKSGVEYRLEEREEFHVEAIICDLRWHGGCLAYRAPTIDPSATRSCIIEQQGTRLPF